MLLPSHRSLAVALAALVTVFSVRADEAKPALKLEARADHEDALYKQGETVTFNIALSGPGAPQDAEVTWQLSKDGVAPFTSGKVKLAAGKATVQGKLDEPGFLHLNVTLAQPSNNGAASAASSPANVPLKAQAGAGIDPTTIKPSLPVPDDFDAFWDAQKKKLAAVPMNPRLTPVTNTGKDISSFDVKLDTVGDMPVSGYYSKRKDLKPKSAAAVLLVHGAGVRSSQLGGTVGWAGNGHIVMDINAHGIENGKPDEFYKALTEGALLNYSHRGVESRDTNYFLGMFLRELRALDFLCAQPEWDGKTLIVWGSSQGGFQAFAGAALDSRVTFFGAGVPAGCDHSGNAAGRVAGWPQMVPKGPDGKPIPQILEASRYFDNMNFATRIKAKACVVTTGFIDTTCPPTSVYAAYNNLPTGIAKTIFHDIMNGHAMSPASGTAMMKALTDYLATAKPKE